MAGRQVHRSIKARVNQKWTATDDYKDNYDRIFGQKKPALSPEEARDEAMDAIRAQLVFDYPSFDAPPVGEDYSRPLPEMPECSCEAAAAEDITTDQEPTKKDDK